MMKQAMSSERSGSKDAEHKQQGFFTRLRAELDAIEHDIQEEFPDWPEIKRRIRRWIVTCFLVGFALVGLLLLRQWWMAREQARRQWERARTIQLISPTEEVREEIIEFVWRPSPLAASYVVELSDATYRLLWQSERVKVVEVTLPQGVRQRLERGQVYIWQVRGFDDKGNEVARSPFDHITIIR
ncbi:MAG TPA: hypothetical protein VNM72_11310 [Blastocatellia bacterium]|nr:hypothetical protein [Blastocatellia bacterium]